MKKFIIIIMVSAFLFLNLGSDVLKKSKSEVSFAKYGLFKTERTEVVSPLIKRTDSNDYFKGKGLLNKLAAKVFFKNGEFTKIIDLKKKIISNINHKKKRIKEREIKKIPGKTEQEEEAEEGDEGEESDVTVTKNKLTVSVTGQKKVINGFPSREYIVLWEVEWERNDGPEKGSSKLVSNVWTTPVTRIIGTAQKAESVFFTNYMKALGLNTDFKQDEILGGSWLRIFGSLSKSSSRQDSEKAAKFRKELLKIKGYPVIVDGEYYTAKTGAKKKKGLKGLLKKKKKKDAEEKPKFTFYTEVLELKLKKSDASDYTYPEGYKIK